MKYLSVFKQLKQSIRASYKGKKVGWLPVGIIPQWQSAGGLSPIALGLTPSDTTFLSSPLLFQRSSDSNGPNCAYH